MITHHSTPAVPPKRVVILGAGGFIARALARDLQENNIPARPVSSAEVNLLQPEAAQKLAGIIQPQDSLVITSALTPEKGKDVNTFMKNLAMIHHLGSFLETLAIQHLIYLSSDAALDEQASLVRESTPRNPNNLYGLMHVAR